MEIVLKLIIGPDPDMPHSRTYVVHWIDAVQSHVRFTQNPMGYAEVTITGHCARLRELAGYKTLATLEEELIIIAQRSGAHLATIQSDN